LDRDQEWIMRLAFTLAVVLTSSLCYAEPRWCATQKDPSNVVVYPPIARAARVSGVVVMRMIYAPNGQVGRTEPIFGPPMLSHSLTEQMKNWTVKTNDLGDELCVTLVIAEFRFRDPDEPPLPPIPARPDPPSILRFWITDEVIIISDPGGYISNNPLRKFEYKVRRAMRRLFHKTS
jgi:hypothetical protein